ncbi:MAG: GTP-binding protein [Armatimonadetes bacterium]|nr:GTP-binding protein [Armatimonadota bacterium]
MNLDTIRAARPKMNIVIVGHVDHGKSTLVGRLFYDTGSLPDGKYEAVARVCEDTGKLFEFAFLLDALEEERDQGITIDTAQTYFSTDQRDYVIIDAPGHKEFLKNMVTGAASADAAILLIDAEEGVQEQSRRHGYLLKLLGIRQVTVVINKMDLVDYSQEVFESVKAEYVRFLSQMNVEPGFVIPVSARDGDNVAKRGEATMPWYDGPTVLESLDLFTAIGSKQELPLRMPVQDVYKFDRRRIVAGRVESGVLKEGDEITFSPSGHKAVVKTIERWNSPERDFATPGESIGITLTEQIFVERGDVVSHHDRAPRSSNAITASLFWLGDRHLKVGKTYTLKLATQELECEVTSLSNVIDTSSLASVGAVATEVAKNEVATVTLHLRKPIAFDAFSEIVETGRFVIVDEYNVAGGGIIPPQPEMTDNYDI